MLQHHDSNVHLPSTDTDRLTGQSHTVLLLDVYVFIIRYDTQDRHAAELLQHPSSLIEELHVAAELIDDNALDEPTVFWCLQHHTAIDGGEDATTVDVAYQNDVGFGMAGHRHVYQVGVAQIDFRDAARPLHHDGIELRRQTVVGRTDLCTKVNIRDASAPIIIRIAVTDRLAVQHHLTGVVTLRLQQQRVHVRVTGDARSLSLHSLRASYLQSVRGCV